MKFGLCTSIDNMKIVEEMGFDYLEPSVVSVAAMDEAEFHEAVQWVKASRIECEAFNVLFPGDIRLTGEGVCEEALHQYLDRAFGRVQQLGAKVIVLGSGGARSIPDGWDAQKGRAQLMKAVGIVGDYAAKYGLTIAIEPLNRKETNIITSVEEGAAFVQELNHPSVKLLADFYHMRMENEAMAVLAKYGSWLWHLHIANSNGRVYVLSEEEDYYKDFFNALREGGYDGRISIEGGTSDMEKEGPVALSVLRSLIQQG